MNDSDFYDIDITSFYRFIKQYETFEIFPQKSTLNHDTYIKRMKCEKPQKSEK